VQANSRMAVPVALGADEGGWLLGFLLPQFPPGSLVDGILFSCCFCTCCALPHCLAPSGAVVIYKHMKKSGICLAPARPYRAALSAESRLTQQTGNHNESSRTVSLAANSISERNVNSLPPLEFDSNLQAHLSDHSAVPS
jgi:hypothetical protein